MTEPKRRLTIVVPCYNDEKVLPELYDRLSGALTPEKLDWEAIFVNDGSRDRTWEAISALHAQHPNVKGVDLSRNFGHQVAVTAGLDHAEGDAVVTMDSDLQDPPEVIPQLLAKWREGYEVVYAVHDERSGDSFLKRASAKFFYAFIQKLAGIRLPQQAGEFRLLDRNAVRSFRGVRETHRYIRGLIVWTGFRQIAVSYERVESKRGYSGYTLMKLVRLAFDAIASFSVIPLRISFFLGLFLFAASVLIAIALVVLKAMHGITYPGWTSLFIAVSFFSGVQLLVLGVLGEYVGRIYEEVKRRPLYFVQGSLGLKN